MLKNIKNYAMALAALAIAATTLASAGISKYFQAGDILADQWYEFTPGTNPPNTLDPSQYTLVGPSHPTECENGSTICAIRVPQGETLDSQFLIDLEASGDMDGEIGNANVKFKDN